MLRHMQDETGIAEDKSVPELLADIDEDFQSLRELLAGMADIDEDFQIARQTPGKGCVYVMAVPGIEAVRIGRTVDLPQRLRWFEYKNFPVEVILVGNCNVVDGKAEWAEAEIFQLLDDIHLAKHNRQFCTWSWCRPATTGICQTDAKFWTLFGVCVVEEIPGS